MISRILSTERIIPNFFINLLGLQVIRYLVFQIFYNLKFLIRNKRREDILTIKKRGFYKIENFLPLDAMQGLKTEFEQLINSDKSQNLQNNGTEYLTVFLNDENLLNDYPLMKKVIEDERVKELFKKSEIKKNVEIKCRLERIVVRDKNIEDTNKNFHYDTFHNTFKAWLYLTDSNDENGPLVILPGSHNFSFKRVLNSYMESLKYSIFLMKNEKLRKQKIQNNFAKDNYQFFRIKNKKNFLSNNSNKMVSKQNTFLFVNTHCIHRRGDAKENKFRDAIHFYSRENPFF